MSASEPETAIFTVDPPDVAHRKIMNAFTGGRATVQEQRVEGGSPDICPIYHYYVMFLKDDKALGDVYERCKSGEMLCGECKAILSERVKAFLTEHQRRREQAKSIFEKFIVRDKGCKT